ncbi:hypothetical protein MKW92_051956 [Papaver armeniacum]|nr:hypothetical protein MKW92_051956 [Papaver armeniacum]
MVFGNLEGLRPLCISGLFGGFFFTFFSLHMKMQNCLQFWKCAVQVVAAVGFMDQRIEIPKDIDPQWASLIKTCLHSDPKCRPTFGKLLEKLNVMRR